MRTTFSIVALALGLSTWSVAAAERAFYRQFQTISASAPPGPLASPLLVDTNNTFPKIPAATLSLENLRRTGQIGGVSVQMTMDEVVERWGKPPKFVITSLGEPFLRYRDVEVLFWPGTNQMITMSVDAKNKRFEHGLSCGSSTNEFISLLGRPSETLDVNGLLFLLIYDTPQVKMYLDFQLGDTNELWQIELDRPPGRTLAKR